ncbi:hypothetical protein [Streptomyces sp. NPDC001508]|uniref:hypothetical protein n=1 Tax=Streptomyces sp. NPDC001508 TaxID=3154656 RepID=UPI00331E6170
MQHSPASLTAQQALIDSVATARGQLIAAANQLRTAADTSRTASTPVPGPARPAPTAQRTL